MRGAGAAQAALAAGKAARANAKAAGNAVGIMVAAARAHVQLGRLPLDGPPGEEVSDAWPRGAPKLVHQTGKRDPLGCSSTKEGLEDSRWCNYELIFFARSWEKRNRDFQRRFYDDEGVLAFVRDRAPEYLAAYQALWKPVLQANFFRYIVVLKEGGLYSDVDVACMRGFSAYFRPTDRLVVGIERLMPSFEAAHFSAPGAKGPRALQFLQWTFGAPEPGHPALRDLCDTIKQWVLTNVPPGGGRGPGPRYSAYAAEHGDDMAIMEFTGPGVWTDAVLRHIQHGAEGIRLLPREAWGQAPWEENRWNSLGQPYVLHHFNGSWRSEGPDA